MKRIRLLVVLSFILSCMLLLFTGCGKTTLATPKNFEVNQETLVLTWDSVKDAKGYKIFVNNEEYNSSKPRYPLEPLAAGDYVITVQAIAKNDDFKDSEIATYTYTRPEESGISFALINNKTEYEVRSMGSAAGDVVIPDVYRNKPVTKIGDLAFANKNKDLTSVTVIGNNLRTIGSRAFYNCGAMTSISLPDSVTEIGAYAFQNCRSLQSVVLPEGLKVLQGFTFAYCTELASVTMPEGLTSIETKAFIGCYKLDNVVIPNSVLTMGEYAFSENKALTNLTIGSGLEVIPEYAFLGCQMLAQINFSEGLKTISQFAFSGCAGAIEVEDPNGSTPLVVPTGLTKVHLPNSVETVQTGAFINCTWLVELTFGDNVSKVGDRVIYNTLLWTASENIVSVDGWILGCKSKEMEEIVFPDGTVGIADKAFLEVDKDWSVSGWALTIPDSVEYIGESAFYNCTKMSSLGVGAGVKTIGVKAFSHCSNLRNTIVRDGLEVIDNYAFQGCTRLKIQTLLADGKKTSEDILPVTLKRIGTYAFENTDRWNKSMGLVYIGDWLVGCTDEAMQVGHIEEGTRGLSDYAFYGAAGLNTVTIPDSVEYIGRCAFYGCASLTQVTLPFGLQAIEEFTFYGCALLQQIYLPNTVTKIGYSAFNKCYSLTTANIPAAVEVIDDYAFYKCTSLTALTFDELADGAATVAVSEKTIGNRTFSTCSALSEIVLPSSVTSIGTHAFYKCIALTSVTLSEGISEVSNYAFYGCEALTTVTLPDTVTKVGNYAFRNCVALTSIDFGEGLQEIGRYAFYGCVALESIDVPASLQKIDDYAFRNCAALKSVLLPTTVETINKHAFNGCNNVTIYVEYETRPMGWLGHWNSSYRTVFWGCTMSEDDSYVVSFVKTATTLTNTSVVNGMAAPTKAGYDFLGWTSVQGGTTAEYTMETVAEAANGTTLYAVWAEKAAE